MKPWLRNLAIATGAAGEVWRHPGRGAFGKALLWQKRCVPGSPTTHCNSYLLQRRSRYEAGDPGTLFSPCRYARGENHARDDSSLFPMEIAV